MGSHGSFRYCPKGHDKYKGGKTSDGHCKVCSSVYKKRYYRVHKTERMAYQSKLITVKNKLKDKPCADCNRKFNPWQMHFDHLPQYKKEFQLSDLRSEKRLIIEAAKCDVVCANCHANRTYKRLKEKYMPKIEKGQPQDTTGAGAGKPGFSPSGSENKGGQKARQDGVNHKDRVNAGDSLWSLKHSMPGEKKA